MHGYIFGWSILVFLVDSLVSSQANPNWAQSLYVTLAPKRSHTRLTETPVSFAQKGGDHAAVAALCWHLFWPTQILETCRWYSDIGVWHSGPPGRKMGICCLWGPVTWNYRLNQVLPISFTVLRLPVSIWHPPLHTSHFDSLPFSPWHSFITSPPPHPTTPSNSPPLCLL